MRAGSRLTSSRRKALREISDSLDTMERTTRDMRETVAQSRGVIIESRELMALMDAQQRVAERRTALRTKERPRKRD